jgi:hypothetical protein
MPHVNAKVTAVPATALGMPAAAAALPRKWEGVDPALERMVLRACLDQAPERRRVREAFKGVQLSIDHCLFKVRPFLFFPSLSSKVLFVIGQPGFNSQRYPYIMPILMCFWMILIFLDTYMFFLGGHV